MTQIAYLVSAYHAASHTFVRREIDALRSLGQEILPFSIRGSALDGNEDIPVIVNQSLWRHILAGSTHLLLRPKRFLSTWILALRHRPAGLMNCLWSQFHFVEASTLAGMLIKSDVSHLHVHFANSGATVGMLAARIAGIKWSLTLHGISETDYPAGVLLPDKLRRAHFVAIASNFMCAQAMRVSDPEYWKNFHIVRCGINPAEMPERQKRDRQAQEPVRIICVGRLSPEKGYAVLAGALSILKTQRQKFSVEIVGDGPSRAKIAHSFVEQGVDNKIVWHGALPEKATLRKIAAADMLVLPSLMEGLPVVLIEAMAIGVPVIASLVAGIPELVDNERTGLTFTLTDEEALAAAIMRLADSPAFADKLAAAGMVTVLDEFTLEGNAKRMLSLFNLEAQNEAT